MIPTQADFDRVTWRWSRAKNAMDRLNKRRERGEHINLAMARAIQLEYDESCIQRANLRIQLQGSAA